jgi:hypothetical protein
MKPALRLLGAALALSVPLRALGAVYHVSPAGIDNGPGTEARPWKTISRAAATAGPGDTVLIGTGTYAERVRLQRSGTPGRPIVFRARDGAEAVIDGTGLPMEKDEGLFEIFGVSYIQVIGLHFAGAGEAGILAERASDLVIRGNHTERTGSSGIGIWGCRDVVVDGNEVTYSCSGKWQEAISIAGTTGFEVVNNHVYNGPPEYRKEGICLKDGSSGGKVHANHVHHVRGAGIYVDAWDKHTFDIEVFGNTVHDVREGNGIALASEMGGLLERIRIHHNVVWRNRWVGILISENGEKVPHPMRDIEIANNTVWGNGTEEWGGGILADNPQLQSAVVRANIVAGNLTFEIAVGASLESTLVIDLNLSHGEHDDPAGRLGRRPVLADPRFADPERGDFRLAQGSPAVGLGAFAP